MTLVYLSLAFVLGTYIGSHFPLHPISALPLFSAAAFILMIGHRSRTLLLAGICIALAVCGMLRFGAVPTGDQLQPYIGRGDVSLVGIVSEEPEPKDSSIKLVIAVREIDGEAISGNLLVRTTRYPAYRYGDLLRLTGELERPPDDIDGFDYSGYLSRIGIYTTMYRPDIELMAQGQGPQPFQSLYSLRHRLGEALEDSIAEPQGSLARAVLLGLRHDIPPNLYADFQRSGTAHLLAISGLHMAIVAGILLSLTTAIFGRQRPTYFIVTLIILWSYAMLAGMSPSVMRAAVMITIFTIGMYAGRQGSSLTAVAFAAAVMVAIAPHIMWQIGFQLSFAAVLGLILLAPLFQRWLGSLRLGSIHLPNIVVYSSAYSLGAILMTLPLVCYHFGYIPLMGLPATFFAAIVLPYTIVLSALAGFFGLASIPVAQVIGWLDWLFLKYTTVTVQLFAAFDFAVITVDRFSGLLVFIYYLITGGLLWLVNRRVRISNTSGVPDAGGFSRGVSGMSPAPQKRYTRWATGLLAVIAVLIWVAIAVAPQSDRLTVSFLDVGQGDAILITSPSGAHILVDGGPSPEKVCAGLGKALPFWDRTIEMAVLTHPHDDHVCGLVEVCRRYDVDRVLYSENILCDSDAYVEWLSVIEERGIPCIAAQAGQRIHLGGGVGIDVLHPQSELLSGTDSDVDNNGVVLQVQMGDVSFLLTGDLYRNGELYLFCRRAGLESTVLKACHHGSKSSTCPQFLSAVDPQIAVISVGVNNRFGHPHDEVMVRLIEAVGGENLYLTSERGTITFTTDGERLWVQTGR